MAAIWQRINTLLLVLVLLALAGILGMLAARTEGGPLDPGDPPAPTDSVRLPGTPISTQMVINSPGRYYLTRDLVITTNTTAIEIEANNVEIDLGGFTISGIDGDTGRGILIEDGFDHVRVRNGSIRDVLVGVDAPLANHVTIDDVSAHSSSIGFNVGELATLTRCRATDNEHGIHLLGAASTVRECLAASNLHDGIWVDLGAQGALIERSVIKNNNLVDHPVFAGIRLEDDFATVRENDFSHEGVNDIAVAATASSNMIIDNALTCLAAVFVDSSATDTYVPVNTTDPHTNVTHSVCEQ